MRSFQTGFIVCLALWHFCVSNYSICSHDNVLFSFLILTLLMSFSSFVFIYFAWPGPWKLCGICWIMTRIHVIRLSFSLISLSLITFSPFISLSLSLCPFLHLGFSFKQSLKNIERETCIFCLAISFFLLINTQPTIYWLQLEMWACLRIWAHRLFSMLPKAHSKRSWLEATF